MKVFLLAGQSNMVGYGLNRELPNGFAAPTRSKIATHMTQREWRPLAPGFGRDKNYFGPEITFEREISRFYPSDRLFFVKVSHGGTSLAYDWFTAREPNGECGAWYALFRDTYRAMLATLDSPEIAGMLWMQGESDCYFETDRPKAVVYEENLLRFFGGVRRDAGLPHMPIVVGQISASLSWAYGSIVREAQKCACEQADRVMLVPTYDLSISSDGTHYDTRGQLELGSRFAQALTTLIDQ